MAELGLCPWFMQLRWRSAVVSNGRAMVELLSWTVRLQLWTVELGLLTVELYFNGPSFRHTIQLAPKCFENFQISIVLPWSFLSITWLCLGFAKVSFR